MLRLYINTQNQFEIDNYAQAQGLDFYKAVRFYSLLRYDGYGIEPVKCGRLPKKANICACARSEEFQIR